jgi:hypothetical protein
MFFHDLSEMLKTLPNMVDQRRYYRHLSKWIDKVPLHHIHQVQMHVEPRGYDLLCGRRMSCLAKTMPLVDKYYEDETNKSSIRRREKRFNKQCESYVKEGNLLQQDITVYDANKTDHQYVTDIKASDKQFRGQILVYEMITPEIGAPIAIDNKECSLRTLDEGQTMGLVMKTPRPNPCKIISSRWIGERDQNSEMLGMAF